MNIPPYIEQNITDAATIDDLKNVIRDILDEYDVGILNELDDRISDLEVRVESKKRHERRNRRR